MRIDNDIKVQKFFSSDLGKAYENKLNSLEMSKNDKREVVLTSKNKVLALLLENSELNLKKLQTSTAEQIAKSQQELNELTA